MAVAIPETITVGELAARMGTEIGVSRWRALDQAQFDAFADVCDDHQFIHTDPERARTESPYDGTIAQGMLTLSLVVPLAREAIPPIAGARRGLNYGFDRVRFIAPVPCGARIRGRFTLLDLDADTPADVTTVTGSTDVTSVTKFADVTSVTKFADVTSVTMRWDVTIEIEGAARPAMVATWINRRYLAA